MVDGLRDDQGKRFRRFFDTKENASAWLDQHREVTRVEGRSGLRFTDAQRADARRALAELTAVPGATLTDAARHYAAHLRRTQRTIPVSELIAHFIAAKQSDGRSPRYLQDLRHRLARFGEDFGTQPAAGLETMTLDDWLRSLDLGAQSRINFRRVLHALFEFARVRNFARENPVANTERPKTVAGEPGILMPDALRRLLASATVELRPSVAIAAFSGLRPAELSRLKWSDVNLEERCISVSAKASKTASRRLAPIPDNLVPWLLAAPSRVGGVVPVNARKLFLAARKAAGIADWPHDALRHSWVSYRFALVPDAARVAAEAGHDQAVLHRHYRALVTRSDAERWFSITPEDGQSLLTFPPSAAMQ